MFCPECGTLMSSDEDGDMECPSCGYIESSENLEEVVVEYEMNEKEEIPVITDEDIEGTSDYKCPDCDVKTQLVQVPPSRGDEDFIEMYKCPKCGNVYRETSKQEAM